MKIESKGTFTLLFNYLTLSGRPSKWNQSKKGILFKINLGSSLPAPNINLIHQDFNIDPSLFMEEKDETKMVLLKKPSFFNRAEKTHDNIFVSPSTSICIETQCPNKTYEVT